MKNRRLSSFPIGKKRKNERRENPKKSIRNRFPVSGADFLTRETVKMVPIIKRRLPKVKRAISGICRD